MSDYRRLRIPEATAFFTVCLAEPGATLLVEEVVRLRAAVRVTMAERPFGILAWVVLPDHLHCVWQMPEGDTDYSTRWGAIKARFTRSVKSGGTAGYNPTLRDDCGVALQPTGRVSKIGKQEGGLWQRRFWEHHIRDEADLNAHVRYCWNNPVKHGLARTAADWPYSSVHRDTAFGRVEELVGPGFGAEDVDGEFGEPGRVA
ncbi:transposase [Aquicoccus sp. G2-2]|uniref:REP-associated tyrosine transposase n=1 Tax=Aquicoccus sp. G2-2 TaxID=3092120 RepID=UPI002AE0A5DA|nr:transposase [Aquicoccus sp. G2-2]MEA1114245.1 transposase [Aquicoccus sp. G2-2]